jgi:copper chaperone CopZ
MENRTVTVPDIGCGGCVSTIQNALGEISGVQSVQGDVDGRQITVSFDTPASWEAIRAKLVEIEYPPAE